MAARMLFLVGLLPGTLLLFLSAGDRVAGGNRGRAEDRRPEYGGLWRCFHVWRPPKLRQGIGGMKVLAAQHDRCAGVCRNDAVVRPAR